MKSIDEIVADILMFQLNAKRDEITPAARLNEDLGCDSLDCIEIMMQIEEEQDIEIEEEESEKIVTVQDLVALVTSKLEAKNAGQTKEPIDDNTGSGSRQ